MLVERPDEFAEVRLNVASGPCSGPPLLLLHGVTRRWQDYLTLLPVLTPRWHVLAPDFRGHGGSGRAAGYLVADYARDAVAFARAHFHQPGVVYGHSLGALVAAAVAAAAPERVRAVVLEDPPAEAFVREVRQTPSLRLYEGMRELAKLGLPVPETAKRLGEILFSPQRGGTLLPLNLLRDGTSLRFSARCLRDLDPDVLTPVVEGRWLDGHDCDGAYRGVRCPALLLAGDADVGGLLPKPEAERVARLMADCVPIHLPRVGHLIHQTATETTLRLVTGFLESL